MLQGDTVHVYIHTGFIRCHGITSANRVINVHEIPLSILKFSYLMMAILTYT